MYKIFSDYHEGVLTGEEKLRDVYAQSVNRPVRWIKCEDISIKELVNQICDEFENEGYDLELLPIEYIRDRFVEFEPTVHIPPNYNFLIETKQQLLDQIELMEGLQQLKDNETHLDMIQKFRSSLEIINRQIKDLI